MSQPTGRECPHADCNNDEVTSDSDDQTPGALHFCDSCGNWSAVEFPPDSAAWVLIPATWVDDEG